MFYRRQVRTLILLTVGCSSGSKTVKAGATPPTAVGNLQQTFVRSDGIRVSCPMPRADAVAASTGQSIQADIDLVKRLVRAETTDSTVLHRIRTQSSDDYAIRVYALCQDYGTNGLTPAEYDKASNLLSLNRAPAVPGP
jgi:hypothetical protein